MRKITFALMLALAGCSSSPYWDKPFGNPEQFAKDRHDCTKEAYAYGGASLSAGSVAPEPNETMFNRCMEARGYRLLRA